MKSEIIRVNSQGEGMEQALEEADAFAARAGAGKEKAIHLRLVSEEMLGMVKAIAGFFAADFWIESDESGSCLVHLDADTIMDYVKKEELLSVSSDGKNISEKGFLGKIRGMFENMLYFSGGEAPQSPAFTDYLTMYSLGTCDGEVLASMGAFDSLWSMRSYQDNLRDRVEEDPSMQDAWDELEKSVLVGIADDIRVGVMGNQVKMIIALRDLASPAGE